MCADDEIGPFPFAMTFARSESLIPCTAALRKSGMLFFLPIGVLPLASAPWQAVHWLLKRPWPVEARLAFDDAAGGAEDVDAAVAVVLVSGAGAFGGGGGFFGRLIAPEDETVSVTVGPAFPLFGGFTAVAVVAVVAGVLVTAVVVVDDIDPVVALVSVNGAVAGAVAVAVDSVTVEVVSLLLVVFVSSDCLQP